MTKLERIEREVASLSAEELEQFRAWFAEHDAEAFDRRIAEDAAAGKLDALADMALADHRAGKTTRL